MLKNYFKIAYRTLLRHKAFSLINLFGLAASLAVCLLLVALVRGQQRYDRFHAKAARIYRVTTDMADANIGSVGLATSPGPMAERISRFRSALN